MNRIYAAHLLFLCLMASFHSGAQVGINPDGSSPVPSAGLDINFTDRGLLPPRLTTLQRDAIPNPAEGLRIFNTDTKCENFFNGISWREICGNCTPLPTNANAGNDNYNIPGTSTVLAANNPVNGSGSWSILSGNGGSFDNANAYNSGFNGLEGEYYLLRWTISNSCGSSEDDVEISFDPGDPCDNQTSMTDSRDSQVYPIVTIGTQCWMAKNLNYGTMINGSSPQSVGQGQKYCYGNNPANCTNEGAFYIWNNMMNGELSSTSNPSGIQGICPSGWHIPSDAEWIQLEMGLGMNSSDAYANSWSRWSGYTGSKLSAQAQNGNNNTGFNGALTGIRDFNGGFYQQGEQGHIWTCTQLDATNAWRRVLRFDDIGVARVAMDKILGYGVRCLKD